MANDKLRPRKRKKVWWQVFGKYKEKEALNE